MADLSSQHMEQITIALQQTARSNETMILNETWQEREEYETEHILHETWGLIPFTLNGCKIWLALDYGQQKIWYDKSGNNNTMIAGYIQHTTELMNDLFTIFTVYSDLLFYEENAVLCGKVEVTGQGWLLTKMNDDLIFSIDNHAVFLPNREEVSIFCGSYDKKSVRAAFHDMVLETPYGSGIMKSQNNMFVDPRLVEFLYYDRILSEEERYCVCCYLEEKYLT